MAALSIASAVQCIEEEARLQVVDQYRHYHKAHRAGQLQAVNDAIEADPILASLAHSVATTLQAQRAMVSIVGAEKQFFIAESTEFKAVQMLRASGIDHVTEVWQGCDGSTSRDVALCAHTIRTTIPQNSYGLFCVPDLSKDERFCDYPYVVGSPHFRFYAGTPLMSGRYRIGSLFVIDDRPREQALSANEVSFLGKMAEHVVHHLDTQRWALQGSMLISLSRDHGHTSNSNESSVVAVQSPTAPRTPSFGNLSSPVSSGRPQMISPSLQIPSAVERAMSQVKSDPRKLILDQCCATLQQSFNADYTVIYDTNHRQIQSGSLLPAARSVAALDYSVLQDGAEQNYASISSLLCNEALTADDTAFGKVKGTVSRMVKPFLAHTSARFPDGAHWQIGSSPQLLDQEALALHQYFPGAARIIYKPIVDHVNKRQLYATFTVICGIKVSTVADIEEAYLNCVMDLVGLQLDKLTNRSINRKREDVLSSISHELRSPLHGILASNELLLQSATSPTHLMLGQDVQACGQMLLHTLDNILDFMNITSMTGSPERSDSKDGPVKKVGQGPLPLTDRPAITTASETSVDLAQLLEEIVRSLCRDRRATSAGNAKSQRIPAMRQSHDVVRDLESQKQTVSVSLKIDTGNWSFMCTPGTMERILMSLLDNSLKFTQQGSIDINLRMLETSRSAGDDNVAVELLVQDTGIGMSTEYLQFHAFDPFSQEDPLTTGLGLGLSIAANTARILNGSLQIESTQGIGTKVKCIIPLRKSSGNHSMVSGRSLRGPTSIPSVAVAGFSSSPSVRRTLEQYVVDWLGLKLETDETTADHLIVDADHIERHPRPAHAHAIVVRAPDRVYSFDSPDGCSGSITLLEPVGPASLLRSLELSQKLRSSRTKPDVPSTISEKSSPSNTRITSPKPGFAISPHQTQAQLPSQTAISSVLNSKQPIQAIVPPMPPITEFPGMLHTTLTQRVSTPPRLAIEPAYRALSVLCVDDNAINLRVLGAFLTKLGVRDVSYAHDGKDAYTQANASQRGFDLIFMDLSMPVCDGFDSTREIRAHERQTPERRKSHIVALTGLSAENDRLDAARAGTDGYLTKPLAWKVLKGFMEGLEGRRYAS